MKSIYLRTARERKRLTQIELAALSRVAQNTISKLELRSDAQPYLATASALAAALDVDIADLRWGPDPTRRRRRRARPSRRMVSRKVA